jgi:acetyltransferase-like isoleucine patch superfamily enzyme
MKKSFLRRSSNRLLHLLARFAPGSQSLRPFLHRLRGVRVETSVFIGDDVYIDNEYPECVEIHENVSISMRAVIIAHTRGPGRVILEKDCFVGPNAVVCCSGGRTLHIGEGAVVSAGCVVTHSVPPRTMVSPAPSRPVAHLKTPLTLNTSLAEFLAGMTPIKSASAAHTK